MTAGSRVLLRSFNKMPIDPPVCSVVIKVHARRYYKQLKREVQYVVIEFIDGTHPSPHYRKGLLSVAYEDLDEGEAAIAAHIALRMQGKERTPDGCYRDGKPSSFKLP